MKVFFNHDPISGLIESGNQAIVYFAKRDLLNEKVPSLNTVWDFPEVKKMLNRQQSNGAWEISSSTRGRSSGVNYHLIETYRKLRNLVDQYEMNVHHSSIKSACDFVFSCQMEEGDFRGMLANQYAPYYAGAILYLLIKAGYEGDSRVERAMQWLISMRQNDGGWVIGSPGMLGMQGITTDQLIKLTSCKGQKTMRCFDRTKPFSAAGTGMVLRAFAVHPSYRHSEYAQKAAQLLISKFFQKDNWSSYEHPDNWLRFQYPFWWTNLISALDSVSQIGLSIDVPSIHNALMWLKDHQEKNGLWKTSYSKIHRATENSKTLETQLWLTLTICRIYKRFLS